MLVVHHFLSRKDTVVHSQSITKVIKDKFALFFKVTNSLLLES
jgi:hypothetical protein